MIVYLAISPSEKKYVGITSSSLKKRKRRHFDDALYKKKNRPFSKAIRKYGQEIKWEILEEVDSLDEAIYLEKYYIKFFDTYKNGYNCTHGGEGAFGREPWNKGKKIGPMNKDAVQRSSKAHKKPVQAVHIVTGEKIYFNGIVDTKNKGFNPPTVTLCCKYPEKYPTHKNYKWKYITS